jgi:hypothetical protein
VSINFNVRFFCFIYVRDEWLCARYTTSKPSISSRSTRTLDVSSIEVSAVNEFLDYSIYFSSDGSGQPASHSVDRVKKRGMICFTQHGSGGVNWRYVLVLRLLPSWVLDFWATCHMLVLHNIYLGRAFHFGAWSGHPFAPPPGRRVLQTTIAATSPRWICFVKTIKP